MRATNPANLILLRLIILIFGEEYKLRLSIMQFYPASCSFLSLGSRYATYCPILIRSQSMLFPQSERLKLTFKTVV
jgi:hypothetical protein